MKRHLGLTLLLLIIGVRPAYADIDYRCLHLCTGQGEPSSRCLPECTYDEPAGPTGESNGAGTAGEKKKSGVAAHDLLQTPVPIGGQVIDIPPSSSAESEKKPEIDYYCFNRCMQTGMQYDMCEQLCPQMMPGALVPLTPGLNIGAGNPMNNRAGDNGIH